MTRIFDESLDRYLPTEALFKGYRLTWWASDIPTGDPVVLTKTGHPGTELYRWNYTPTMGEVWDKIQELESQQ